MTDASNIVAARQSSEEIDLIELVQTLWDGKWFIALSCAFTCLCGLLYLSNKPIIFEARGQFTPTSIFVSQEDIQTHLERLPELISIKANKSLNVSDNWSYQRKTGIIVYQSDKASETENKIRSFFDANLPKIHKALILEYQARLSALKDDALLNESEYNNKLASNLALKELTKIDSLGVITISPAEKIAPQAHLILALASLIGLFAGSVFVLAKSFWLDHKRKQLN